MRYVLVALLAGCASNPSMNWTKAGGSPDQMNADRYSCIQERASARPIDADAAFDACMRARGWRPA